MAAPYTQPACGRHEDRRNRFGKRSSGCRAGGRGACGAGQAAQHGQHLAECRAESGGGVQNVKHFPRGRKLKTQLGPCGISEKRTNLCRARAALTHGVPLLLGGRVKTWKRRWFILTDNCLYYFEYTTDKEPRGIIPLENLSIREVEDPRKPNCFELYNPSHKGQVIKACKTEADGRVVEGNHVVHRISAPSPEEKAEWMKSIRCARARGGGAGGRGPGLWQVKVNSNPAAKSDWGPPRDTLDPRPGSLGSWTRGASRRPFPPPSRRRAHPSRSLVQQLRLVVQP
ncbi:uncharacterized protein LOC132477001 [Mesoplodon densirostris]|uniref:uncharacterized protein LOC132477001 n=1 Tax=Mesoplodon densirostris TaxID=48708 RepID=UPI0028DCCCA1|nr:uncharacterized protein LOC132477001 [Mesoplodon densirostris]